MDRGTISGVRAGRRVRAVGLATVALVTGVIGHAVAGGRIPSVDIVVALLAGAGCGLAPLLRRPASARHSVLLLGGDEPFAHLWLITGMPGSERAPECPSVRARLVRRWPVDGERALMAGARLAAAGFLRWWLAAGRRALRLLLCLTLRPVRHATAAFSRLADPPLTSATLSRMPSCGRVPRAPTLSVLGCRVAASPPWAVGSAGWLSREGGVAAPNSPSTGAGHLFLPARMRQPPTSARFAAPTPR